MDQDPICGFEYGFEAGLLGHEISDAISPLDEAISCIGNNAPPSGERDAVIEELTAARQAIYVRNLTPKVASQAVLALMEAVGWMGEYFYPHAIDRARQMTAAAARGSAKRAAGSAAWADWERSRAVAEATEQAA